MRAHRSSVHNRKLVGWRTSDFHPIVSHNAYSVHRRIEAKAFAKPCIIVADATPSTGASVCSPHLQELGLKVRRELLT